MQRCIGRLRRLPFRGIIVLVALCGATPMTPAISSSAQSQNHGKPENHRGGDETERTLQDCVVLTQDGRAVRFYTDLVKDRIVVINFVFTSCNFMCAMQGETFSKLQDALGERLGRDVYLISISIDPVTDKPESVKAWGAKYGAKAGWTLLTGAKSDIDSVLISLTGAIPGRDEHTPALLIVNGHSGERIRMYGLAEPESLVRSIDKLMVDGLPHNRAR